MRILIVDDRSDNLYLLQSLLEGNGHTVTQAVDGEEALKIMRESIQPDLVISDILMPGMDGFTLCREIRKDPILHDIPFITYTATYTGRKDEELARKIGSDDFIVKPCEPDEFMRRIDKVMQNYLAGHNMRPESELSENEVLKLYNERLVRKLEHKMMQTEREVLAKNLALEALSRSEELLNTTQRIAKIGGWQYDLKTNDLYWTRELYILHDLDPDTCQLSPEERISYSLSCYTPEDEAIVAKAFERCQTTGEPYSLECRFATSPDRQKIVSLYGNAIKENGVITKVYGSFQDITDSIKVQEEQHKLRNQLLQVQKLDSIGRLAGGVAHDFNNILTVITGYTEEVLRNLKPGTTVYEDVEQISKAGLRASALVRQLLTFSRKQPGKVEVMQLNNCLEDIHKMLMRLLGEDICIELDLDPQLSPIKADTGQIEQIIINLGINAREAMPRGGKICMNTRNIAPGDHLFEVYPAIPAADYVLLEVKDTGMGMDEDTMEHIFEPFFTTKGEKQGTGLGLATVYGIINQSQAHIRVQSSPGLGTTFLIFFPAVSAPVQKDPCVSASQASGDQSKLIMIVEDDQSIREMLRRMLVKLGYQVTASESADEAIKLFEDEQFKPDLLITDYVMAGMNGLELADEIGKLSPDIRLILMSGYMERLAAERDNAFAKVSFLQKPFTRAELAERISQSLK